MTASPLDQPIDQPPVDITPAEFFETWLPARVKGASAPLTVRVVLAGDGGGAWDLRVGPTGLTTIAVSERAGEDKADVTIAQTVADWRAIVVGEPGAVSLAPPQAKPTDILFLDAASQKILHDVRGAIRFEVTGYNGRTWSLNASLGVAADRAPDATISVDAETYAAMRARTIAAPQAFFTGKIKLTGDVNLAMQLGMAMMPRL